VPWEIVISDLKPVNGLIDTNVHKRSLWVDIPSFWVWQLSKVRSLTVGNLDDIPLRHMFSGLGNALRAPKPGSQIHSLSLWLQVDEVLDDRGVLERGSTLVQHNGVVIWHIQQSAQL